MNLKQLEAITNVPQTIADLQYIARNVVEFYHHLGALKSTESTYCYLSLHSDPEKPCRLFTRAEWMCPDPAKVESRGSWSSDGNPSKLKAVYADNWREILRQLFDFLITLKSENELKIEHANNALAEAARHMDGLAQLYHDFNDEHRHDKAQDIAAFIRGSMKSKMLTHDPDLDFKVTKFDPVEIPPKPGDDVDNAPEDDGQPF